MEKRRNKKRTIEVNRAGAIGVDLLDHHVQLFICQLVIQFSQDLAQARRRDVAVAW